MVNCTRFCISGGCVAALIGVYACGDAQHNQSRPGPPLEAEVIKYEPPAWAEFRVELAVARDLLRDRSQQQPVALDSMFAADDAAPGHATKARRLPARTMMLADSLSEGRNSDLSPIRLLLSKPEIRGDSARMTATALTRSVDPVLRRTIESYETNRYILVRAGANWHIRIRQNLGMS